MIDPKTLTPPTTPLSLVPGMSIDLRGKAIVAYAKTLFVQYGITDWRIGFDKAKRRAGCCHWRRKKITLSSFFATHNTVEEIQGTLVHEIAHALAGHAAGHGPVWRAIAIAMGDDGQRCYDSAKVVMPEGKFVYSCNHCNREVHKHKRYRNGTACGECCRKYNGGKYSKKYLLIYKGIGTPTPNPVPAPKSPSPSPSPSSSSTGSGKTKTERMIELYNQGTTSISMIANIVGAHYSHVHTVIKKHKANQ
jgi:predicted SprT family Zn-dependent metalloprotease